jgi:hypothetical protein
LIGTPVLCVELMSRAVGARLMISFFTHEPSF